MRQQVSNTTPWVVLKFGGSSVSVPENWPTIAKLVRARQADGLRPMIVISALSDVSNLLEECVYATSAEKRAASVAAVIEKHETLGAHFELDAGKLLAGTIAELRESVSALPADGQADPADHAAIVGIGELLSTRLGLAIFARLDVPMEWLDARRLLTGLSSDSRSRLQNYVSAPCDFGPDKALTDRLGRDTGACLTQGFIASNDAGDTVLLGREGSDTSAAYLATKLSARHVEIWTDVPGMFSADPRRVPSARLLKEISFPEAQELASTGSKVLHPRSLSPLRQHAIPLHVRCTHMPDVEGTRIAAAVADSDPQVKGLSTRGDVTLISMQSAAMWHEVGFLASAFERFRNHGVSVDLISTSETNVTVTIDAAEDLHTEEVLSALVSDLEEICRVEVRRACAVISLVGQRIRAVLARLGPALEVFEEEKIHLMSLAANDLNLSFVIDEEQVQRLLLSLHSTIIRAAGADALFGPSWESLAAGEPAQPAPAASWWNLRRDELLGIAEAHNSAYVYDRSAIRKAAEGLLDLPSVDRVLYAMKANNHPEVIRELASLGVDFDCVSPGEVDALQQIIPDFDLSRVLFTPNFAPRAEYEWAIERGLRLTLDNLYPLQAWPELFGDQEVFVRIDPGKGRGHHDHVRTAGAHSKFGVPLFELDELESLLTASGAILTGLHAHTGSGILDPDNWNTTAERLAEVARRFPTVRTLDLGGGLGVPEKAGDEVFDLKTFDRLLTEFRDRHPDFELWLEPGRFLVAQSGVLVSCVTQIKGKGDLVYVGIGTGMNSLIRPALYGAYHDIVNLSKMGEPSEKTVTVVGPICESGDKLGVDRRMPDTREGDVLLIANAGAYGRVMASSYNLREAAPEFVI